MNHIYPKALRAEQDIQALRQRLEGVEERSWEQLGSLSRADSKICDLHCLLGEAERECRGRLYDFEQTEQERAGLRGAVREALAEAEALRERAGLVEKEQCALRPLVALAACESEVRQGQLREARAEARAASQELAASGAAAARIQGEVDESEGLLCAQRAELRATRLDESLRQEEVERAAREEHLASSEAAGARGDCEASRAAHERLERTTGELRDRLELLRRGAAECPGMSKSLAAHARDDQGLRDRLAEAEAGAARLRAALQGRPVDAVNLRARLDEALQRGSRLSEQTAGARRGAEELLRRCDELEGPGGAPERARLEEAVAACEHRAGRLRAEAREAEQEDRGLRGGVEQQESEARELLGSLEQQDAANGGSRSRLRLLSEEAEAGEKRRGVLEKEVAEQLKKGCSVL